MQKNILLFLLVSFMYADFCFGQKTCPLFSPTAPKDSLSLLDLPEEFNRFAVRDFALSPVNDELFFTIESGRSTFSAIIRMRKTGNKWSTDIASFSGKYSDLEPAFSPDGKTLYFVSNRPVNHEGKEKDFDIWKTEKINDAWQEPVNLGVPVNTEANEFYPSVSNNGSIYFTAEYENSKGKEDIWMSKLVNGKFVAPESLSDSVNSAFYEFNAYVCPDESCIIFTSFGRDDDMGGGDLYISKKDNNGNWTKAKNLGPRINSISLDFCPYITPDKKIFVFTSNRTNIRKVYNNKWTLDTFLKELGQMQNGKGNLYEINADEILK